MILLLRDLQMKQDEKIENGREKNNLSHGCIYSAVGPLPASIGQIPNIFVIEMNINTNSIIAIGLVKNRLCLKKHNVYSESKYNYFTYKSNYRISSRYFSEIFTDKELEKITLLEKYLFRVILISSVVRVIQSYQKK